MLPDSNVFGRTLEQARGAGARAMTAKANGKAHGHDAERAAQHERNLLGCLLESPDLLAGLDLSADEFLLEDHSRIYRAMKQLRGDGHLPDLATVAAELAGSVSIDYVGGLVDGIVRTKSNFKSYVRAFREAAQLRRFYRLHEQLPSCTTHDERLRVVASMQELLQSTTAEQNSIRAYGDVAEVLSIGLDYIEPIVPGLLGRGTVNLLSGDPGIGKSFLAHALAVSCALGSEFLGRTCQKTNVLMLDRENPLALVQKRLGVIAGGPVPNLKIWGGWLDDPPAFIGDPRLLQMARAEGPLLFIFDSFVRFHEADENSASEMRSVMQAVRRLADAGSTVLLLHHKPKAQQTMYRGSSDILAGVDVAYSLEHADDGLKLVGYKARDSELNNIGIQVDFANGRFLATDTHPGVAHRDSVELLRDLIRQNPGASQTWIAEQSALRRDDVFRLLRSNVGITWKCEDGPRHSRLYYPLDWFLRPVPEELPEPVPGTVPATARTGSAIDSHCAEPVEGIPVVPSLSTPRGGKRELVALGNSKTRAL